jgi:hypothetical protein
MIILLREAANAPFSIPAHRENWMTLPVFAVLALESEPVDPRL